VTRQIIRFVRSKARWPTKSGCARALRRRDHAPAGSESLGWQSWKTLVSVTAYHSLGGEWELRPRYAASTLQAFANIPRRLRVRTIFYLGTIDGSPPGVPGGGITGVLPPPTGGAAIPGSIPAGGQMMPFDCDSWSLSGALPVVSPNVGKAPR
jgi:hypothetical protein